jgi:hypothetical protein
MSNIARDGAPKKLAPVEIHGSMYHFRNGTLVRELSRTQAAALDDGVLQTTPTVEKNFKQVDTHPSMALRGANRATRGNAEAVLRDVSAPGAVKSRS